MPAANPVFEPLRGQDFDAAAQESIKTVIASEADVVPSAVELTLTSASVLVAATIHVDSQEQAAAKSSTLASGALQDADTLETKLARWLLVHGVATSKTFSEETRRGETSSAWEKTFVSARQNKHATTHARSLKDLTKLAVDNDGTSEAGGAQAEET